MDSNNLTPMIKQYIEIKEDYADAVVFFRLGDFYEMFFDDAIKASKILEIALTSKDAGKKIPMCGVPFHSARVYIQKLINNGYKVAIAEQLSEPGKGLVKREVIRVITPGTIIEDELIDAKNNNYIASLGLLENGYAISYVDISTGETYLLYALPKKELFDTILNLGIKEIVLANKYDETIISFLEKNNLSFTICDATVYSTNKILNSLSEELKKIANLLIIYLETTQKQDLRHLMPFIVETSKMYMKLDHNVRNHLEIEEGKSEKSTLLYYLDHTETAMGGRKLRFLLRHPILDIATLNKRYDYIEAFMEYKERNSLINILKQVYDINRINSRIALQSASARDLWQLKNTLGLLPQLKQILNAYENELITTLSYCINPHQNLYKLLEEAIVETPPISVREGGMFKYGYNKMLDEFLDISSHGSDWLVNFENEERIRTGIKNLKIGYNRVFGYYIEVSKGNISLIKEEYQYTRKQTLSGSERYITPILKEKEDLILHAEDKRLQLEYELLKELREYVMTFGESLQKLSSVIADVDLYLSLAIISSKYHYVRPVINNDSDVCIVRGRHPVVERNTKFVENDIIMKEHEVFLITGPNMSGKSTYMRMFALIVYMAQCGFFVPASTARIPLYDAIFTRIGSSDDLAGGKSTFMVEMIESNEALTKATEKSLILFDEIGRGTATYDGMALAQGMIEYIAKKIGAQTLFSTHYHELTILEETLPNITNMYVKAKEENGKMVFLYTVERGKSDKSYGLQVAALANLPSSLLKRSRKILDSLEEGKSKVNIDLFNFDEYQEEEKVLNVYESEIIEELKNLDIEAMRPIDALVMLSYLKNKIKG